MSFILDALKKSETDRQRQNGPALFEVRVAPPRNSLPVWAIGLGVLLAVNLVIVAWVLLRHSSSDAQATNNSPAAGQTQTAPVSGTAPIAPMGQTAGLTQVMQPNPAMAANQPQSVNGGGQGQYGNGGQPGGAQYANAGQSLGGQSGGVQGSNAGNGPSNPGYPNGQPGNAPAPAGQTAPYAQQGYPQQGAPQPSLSAHGSAPDPGGTAGNPEDLAPAADPGPPQPFGNHVSRATNSGVPLYQDAALNTHLPTLRLDLHVFAAKPQDRFVMINMHKLHEGDTLPSEGVRVENITPEGAILSHDGARFLLTKE